MNKITWQLVTDPCLGKSYVRISNQDGRPQIFKQTDFTAKQADRHTFREDDQYDDHARQAGSLAAWLAVSEESS